MYIFFTNECRSHLNKKNRFYCSGNMSLHVIIAPYKLLFSTEIVGVGLGWGGVGGEKCGRVVCEGVM